MTSRLVLLPGMDGTGDLFEEFVKALPDTFQTVTVRYPTDVCLGYAGLEPFVREAAPVSEPFVLLAESFSTPLAIRYAATNLPNLRGLILCAGFVASPLRGWRRLLALMAAPIVFRLPMPDLFLRFLVGEDASLNMQAEVRKAISAVKPKVLASRLHAVLACDESAELVQVKMPILYLQASQDRLVPASSHDEIRQISPQMEILFIAGPHLLIQREPRMTAEAVARFVGRLPMH